MLGSESQATNDELQWRIHLPFKACAKEKEIRCTGYRNPPTSVPGSTRDQLARDFVSCDVSLTFFLATLSRSPASYYKSNLETSTLKLLISKPPFLETSQTDKSVHPRTFPKWDRLFKLLTRLQLAPTTLIFTSPYNHNGISAIKMDLLISIHFSLSLLITVEHKLISA